MSKKLSNSDISLREVRSAFLQVSTWTADYYGQLPTGEWLDISREGDTLKEALQNLKGAIKELGWGFQDAGD